MYATIQKWGNSNGLRFPKALLDAIGLKENDRVELIQSADAITIKKASPTQHKTLEERLTAFYGKPIEQIDRIPSEEMDWGKAEGSEAWSLCLNKVILFIWTLIHRRGMNKGGAVQHWSSAMTSSIVSTA